MNTFRKLLTEARSEIIGGLVVAAVLAIVTRLGTLYAAIGARPFVLGALGILWLAYLSYVSYWIYKWRPPNKIILLLASFGEPGLENYRVMDFILRSLDNALKPYDDTTIETLGRIKQAEGSAVARAEGENRKAAVVIWGWYAMTEEAVQVSANFEVLGLQEYLLEPARETRGYLQTVAVSELQEFRLQVRLSQEMAYLSRVTIGVARYAAEDWDGAIRCFSEVLKQVEEDVPAFDHTVAYFYRGTAYLLKDESDKAIADFHKAIELKPDYAAAYNNRGNARRVQGDLVGAIADFDRAIELDPDDAVAYTNRGVARSDQGDLVEAIADYDKAIELEPDDVAAYTNRGLARHEQGDLVGAIADYDKAIQLKPDYAAAYGNLGIAYRDLGQVERARDCLTQALAIFEEIRSPDSEKTRRLLAELEG